MTRYVVGIDLGTTNSAVAYVSLADADRRVASCPILQVVSEGTVAERPTLPSFLYVGGGPDLGPGSLALPWDADRRYAVGEFAREQGAKVPGRLVSSAKSWLCHGGVDREAAILPWGAPDDVPKLSPVDASARYLRHIAEAWNVRFSDAPLAEQDVILTVPASFDEVARELTLDAATRAGLERVVLLEEPQAAFYAWLHSHEAQWEEALGDHHLVLVIDVGGGTTDFSLVKVQRDDGRLTLERLAVGDHLLLGGDNIDVALARALEPRLGAKLDSQRWHALTNLCRSAKEVLLGPDAPETFPVRLVGRGRSVVGGVLTASLARAEVEQLVLDGFFPFTRAEELPRRTARVGLQEFGLPFASEPEVPRHLGAFLRQHLHDDVDESAAPAAGADRWPDAVLFNGGALTPVLIRQRLTELLASWAGQGALAVLEGAHLDLAVARGAAYYGLVRRGRGVRIGGGTARAYYVGVGSTPSAAAVDTTTDGEVTALCLVPRGMHEGEEVELADPPMEVLTNRGVSFPLYASSTRLGDQSGQLICGPRESFTDLPPIRTVLRFGKKLDVRTIPVHLAARVTEIGTLELWARSLTTPHRWRLQFQLRDETLMQKLATDAAESQPNAEAVVTDAQFDAANATLRAVFARAPAADQTDPLGVVRVLEDQLGSGKDAWPLATIRALWDTLWQCSEGRAVSAAHEARWLNLSGFLLRPGFGAELDTWRIEQLWKVKSAGLKFPRATQVRAEWWNMWKRVAGGLSRPQQLQLHTEVAPWLVPRLKGKTRGASKPGPQEIREYWQLMGSCERLSAEMKAELGEVLVALVVRGKASETDMWALGRLGARAPMCGPLNCVVRRDQAARWVTTLLDAKWGKPEPMVFLLLQLARCVGDRERDLDERLRQRVAERVRSMPSGARAARLLTEYVPIETQERARILDESLPIGLQLRAEGTGA
jgi:molecular chaperone DnaK (HSP70)